MITDSGNVWYHSTAPFSNDPDFTFTAKAVDGSTVTEEFFRGNKLTMVNFWEVWCPPCVGEMPDLQKLSETYADQGFAVLAVYASEQNVPATLAKLGVKYTVIAETKDFQPYRTDYVPTTFFVDGSGKVILRDIVGARSYEVWAAGIEELLK